MYKIGICDDEKKMCTDLENMIDSFFKKRGESCEIQVWNSSESLRNDMPKFRPEILFLDIELPTENGVSVGKFIRDDLGDEAMNIVFISHKTNYAMELFQIHPYDFLVKPFQEELLYATISKILKLEEIQNKEFRYTYNRTEYSVPYGDVLFFSSRNKLVLIHKCNGEVISYYGKLKDIADKLPFQFACISKSYIINMKHVTSWKYDSVLIEDGTRLPIAQSQRNEFKKLMYNYSIGEVK
ncbi:MAG: response regulator transcription factor [Clostridiales bacterium]|nr:response regulator transcription factor [Clostridiales bacterium]